MTSKLKEESFRLLHFCFEIEGLGAPLLNENPQNNPANQKEENNENRNIVRSNVMRGKICGVFKIFEKKNKNK